MSEQEKKVKTLRTLKEIAEKLNEGNELRETLDDVLHELLNLTGFQTAWIYLIEEDGTYELIADVSLPDALARHQKILMCEDQCYCLTRYANGSLNAAINIINCKRIETAIEKKTGDTEGITHHATVPLKAGKRTFGLLNVAAKGKVTFTPEELSLLESIALQIGTAIQRIELVQSEQQHALLTERNRLAQDLHDSVNQMLFSVSLTAKAARKMTNDQKLGEMIDFIQHLSQDALIEMRSLIWQLRPRGLEKGLTAAIEEYAQLLGLACTLSLSGCMEINHTQNESLFRICQEALNNCQKHAGVHEVEVGLYQIGDIFEMQIIDHGNGFQYDERSNLPSLGLKGMKERAEKAGGTLNIHSQLKKGTTVTVRIPFFQERKGSL
ncbi:GAF domain-containing sensor histidine kinase [Bacillus sp. NPDC077027]|uniref:GAF domain-containing sensor histidine kinase n=1 Tax=Bacillus sp. NPDC077027 TaxID=3390548 RepID=UPI003D03F55F